MALTRKDFIRRANIIKQIKSPRDKKLLTETSIQEFKMANPRFDETRFRKFIKKR